MKRDVTNQVSSDIFSFTSNVLMYETGNVLIYEMRRHEPGIFENVHIHRTFFLLYQKYRCMKQKFLIYEMGNVPIYKTGNVLTYETRRHEPGIFRNLLICSKCTDTRNRKCTAYCIWSVISSFSNLNR